MHVLKTCVTVAFISSILSHTHISKMTLHFPWLCQMSFVFSLQFSRLGPANDDAQLGMDIKETFTQANYRWVMANIRHSFINVIKLDRTSSASPNSQHRTLVIIIISTIAVGLTSKQIYCNVSAGHPSKLTALDIAWLRNEVGRINHMTRKASSLASVLISLICHITPFSRNLRPEP